MQSHSFSFTTQRRNVATSQTHTCACTHSNLGGGELSDAQLHSDGTLNTLWSMLPVFHTWICICTTLCGVVTLTKPGMSGWSRWKPAVMVESPRLPCHAYKDVE